jgi:hypothetical protein
MSVRSAGLADLVGDRFEDRVRRLAACDERGYAPKGGLLLDQRVQVLARLCVGDCGRDELCERGQALLGPLGKPVFARGGHDHHAPQAPLDADRHADRGAHAGRTRRRRERSLLVRRQAVDTTGRLAVEHDRAHVAPTEARAPADKDFLARPRPAAHHLDRVAVVAGDHREVSAGDDVADLLGDRPEHRRRRRGTCHQRGHAPQGRLLLGQPTRFDVLRTAHWVHHSTVSEHHRPANRASARYRYGMTRTTLPPRSYQRTTGNCRVGSNWTLITTRGRRRLGQDGPPVLSSGLPRDSPRIRSERRQTQQTKKPGHVP